MAYVQRQYGESFEAMLSRFNKKVRDGEILHDARGRNYFVSDSDRNRQEDRAALIKMRVASKKAARR